MSDLHSVLPPAVPLLSAIALCTETALTLSAALSSTFRCLYESPSSSTLPAGRSGPDKTKAPPSTAQQPSMLPDSITKLLEVLGPSKSTVSTRELQIGKSKTRHLHEARCFHSIVRVQGYRKSAHALQLAGRCVRSARVSTKLAPTPARDSSTAPRCIFSTSAFSLGLISQLCPSQGFTALHVVRAQNRSSRHL